MSHESSARPPSTPSVIPPKTRPPHQCKCPQALFTQEQMDRVIDDLRVRTREANAKTKRFVSDDEWESIDQVAKKCCRIYHSLNVSLRLTDRPKELYITTKRHPYFTCRTRLNGGFPLITYTEEEPRHRQSIQRFKNFQFGACNGIPGPSQNLHLIRNKNTRSSYTKNRSLRCTLFLRLVPIKKRDQEKAKSTDVFSVHGNFLVCFCK